MHNSVRKKTVIKKAVSLIMATIMVLSLCFVFDVGGIRETKAAVLFNKAKIDWRLIKIQGKYGILMADAGIDCQRFNQEGQSYKWEQSYLKEWLNNDFYNTAFSEDEKKAMVKLKPGIENAEYCYVTIPSADDITNEELGFSSDRDEKSSTRIAPASEYAEYKGVYTKDNNCSYWILEDDGTAATVRYDGWGYNYDYQLYDIAVRPIIAVDLTSPLATKLVGTYEKRSMYVEEAKASFSNPRKTGSETTWDYVAFGSYNKSNSLGKCLYGIVTKGDNFSYSTVDSDSIAITGYEYNNEATVIIPEIYDRKKVVKLDTESLKISNATKVILPNNLTTMSPVCIISDKLTEITIPKNVEEISNPFSFCPSLKNIYVSSDSQYLKAIDGVLYNKSGTVLCSVPVTKSSVSIPSTVTKIGAESFLNCKNITSVSIPSSVQVINNCAFVNTGIKSVTIPKTVTGIGNYSIGYDWDKSTNTFSKKQGFTIYCYSGTAGESYAKSNGIDYMLLDSVVISACTISLGSSSFTYDGTYKKPTVTVKYGSTQLKEGTDYSLAYSNNLNAGTAYVTVTGMGKYSGSVKKNYTISAMEVRLVSITISPSSFTYDGTPKTPEIILSNNGNRLVKDTDYTLSYFDNVNAGQEAYVLISGKGNYTSDTKVYFKITPMSLSDAAITLSNNEYSYDGYEKKPTVTVSISGKKLVKDTDYTVSYANNVNAGTASVTVEGKGNYKGSKSVSFKIKSATPVKEYKQISEAKITLSKSVYAYDGNAKKPTVKVMYNGTQLVKGTDYKIAYSNNTYIGTAKVTVTGIGDYEGIVKKTFKIKRANLTYRAYLQKKGWQPWATAADTISKNPGTAGGKNDLRMETIQMQLSGVGGYVSYRAYVQREGWTGWARTDKKTTYAGTKGKGLRVEAIQLKTSGEIAGIYDIYYRSYSDSFGWLGWAKNGETSGTAGFSYKLRGFQVMLYPKGAQGPSAGKNKPYIKISATNRKKLTASAVPDYSKAQYMIGRFQDLRYGNREYNYKNVLSGKNILLDVLSMPSFLGLDSTNIFSAWVTVAKVYDRPDPLNRFDDMNVWTIKESDLDWLCKNVLNISASDLSILKNRIETTNRNVPYKYMTNYFVPLPLTGMTNFSTRITNIETDGTYYYFTYDIIDPYEYNNEGTFEAVMKRKTSNGNSYWSVYSVTKK